MTYALQDGKNYNLLAEIKNMAGGFLPSRPLKM